jgi:4-diphosphocytidyl-2-C-methyl-D-erythritol kinase
MPISVRSFAKINLGLRIGPRRPDGFHGLLTVYQTIGLYDQISVSAHRGTGIEIRCSNPNVPTDQSNTCFRVAELALESLKVKTHVVIDIEKKLPIQGGLGGASSNAVAALLALERALKKSLPAAERLRIAAEVGSDLPLFLIGGAVLGLGRGEQVYPLPDFPATPCVTVTPQIGVSTPKAFTSWDRKLDERSAPKLTLSAPSDRMVELGRELSSQLSEIYSGAPFRRGRRENPLFELVRTGIQNDFEQVVFPEYPELSEVKKALERAGAKYASLSGSGSTVYGLFASKAAARLAAAKLSKQGWAAQATVTQSRTQYWSGLWM